MNNIKIFIGLLWCLSLSASFAYQNFHGCTLAPDNATGWVVTLDSTIILKTTDGGVNWTEQANPADRRFFDVTCYDTQNAWTCGVLSQILHTADGGQNWNLMVVGAAAKYATRIEFIDANKGWAVCGDGAVLKSTDSGANWVLNFTPFIFLPELYGVSFIDTLRGWIVSGWPDTLTMGQAIIARSTDGGIHWDSLFQSSNYDDYFDVHFFNGLNGVIVGGDEQDYTALVLISTDGGVSWNQVSTPSSSFYLRALDFVGGQGWAVGRFGTIIHTHDYGQTWVLQTNPATSTLFDVDFSDTLHGLACGTGVILYTYDGGETWHDGTGIAEADKWEAGNRKLEIYPNPSFGLIVIKYVVSSKQQDSKNVVIPTLRVHDAAGRLVRSFKLPATYSILRTNVIWDGSDDAGRPVPAGVYFIQLTGCDETVTAKVILKR